MAIEVILKIGDRVLCDMITTVPSTVDEIVQDIKDYVMPAYPEIDPRNVVATIIALD